MKGRNLWIEAQKRALELYDEVRRERFRIPRVVEVEVGITETGGELTEEVAFRVYVAARVPESSLPPEYVIPKMFRGLPADVIKMCVRLDVIGFDDEDDWKLYFTKFGRNRIENDKVAGTDRLGCLCRLAACDMRFCRVLT